MRLVLGSTCPHRREIFALLGLRVDVIDHEFDEVASPDRPIKDEALDFAVGKAASVARNHPESLVIGSDTMILLDDTKIGKPSGIDDARAILRSLAGKTHLIFTSIAILDGSLVPQLGIVDEVSVKMRNYLEVEVERYIDFHEFLDKAVAYS